jgi:hypothetical protein
MVADSPPRRYGETPLRRKKSMVKPSEAIHLDCRRYIKVRLDAEKHPSHFNCLSPVVQNVSSKATLERF